MLDVGTTIGYMSSGVNGYTGGWKLLGVDKKGRLLIMSTSSITGNKITLTGKDGYKNGIKTLDDICSEYKDGTIGVEARSIKVTDVDALTSFDKTTYGVGKAYAYGNKVEYSWTGTAYPKYTYGSVSNKLSTSHSSGFNYFDEEEETWVTSPYANKQEKITTLISDYYYYIGSNYLSNSTKAYTMIFGTASTSDSDIYWLASRYTYTDIDSPDVGLRRIYQGKVYDAFLVYTTGKTSSGSYAARAVVTLAENVNVKLNETTGVIDILD